DVRLDLVPKRSRPGARGLDGVQSLEKLAGLVTFTEHGECDDGPDRRVRVLSAVLADPRDVPLDVAGVEGRAVEWRGQQQHKTIVATKEKLFNGRHRARRAPRLGRPGDHPP